MEIQFCVSMPELSQGPGFSATSPDIKTNNKITKENLKLRMHSEMNEKKELQYNSNLHFSPNKNKNRIVYNDKCLKDSHFIIKLDLLLKVPFAISKQLHHYLRGSRKIKNMRSDNRENNVKSKYLW